jgi:hypothetical protein
MQALQGWLMMCGNNREFPALEPAFLGLKYIKHVAIHVDEAEMHVDLEDSGKTMAMAQAVLYRETNIKSLTLDIRLCRFPDRVIKDRRRGIPLEQGWLYPLRRGGLPSMYQFPFDNHLLRLSELFGKGSDFYMNLRFARNVCLAPDRGVQMPTRKLYIDAEFFHSPFWKAMVWRSWGGYNYGRIIPLIIVESWAAAWEARCG